MSVLRLLVALLATLALLPAAAQARTIRVDQVGVTRTIHCSRTTVVEVSGARADLTLTGHCRAVRASGSGGRYSIRRTDRLEVNGSRNRLSVRIVDRINAAGSRNRIKYQRSSRGGAASVSAAGVGTHVARG